MSKLIMAHKSPNLTIGGIYKGLGGVEKDEFLADQPYRVIRRATPDEYVESCLSLGLTRDYMELLMRTKGDSRYYYEIQTD